MQLTHSPAVVVNLTTPFPLQSVAAHLALARRNSPVAAAAIKTAGERFVGSYASQLGKLAGLEKPPLPLVLNILSLCLLCGMDVTVIVDREEIELTSDAAPSDFEDPIERARRLVVSRLFRTP